MNNIQSLNGVWDWRIGDGEYTKTQVPASKLCVGISDYLLCFDAAKDYERAFLVFEGITYRAWVTLNGVPLSELAPYIEHRIEITDYIKPKGNILNVKIQDIGLPFGPSAGWENYSGIIRNVYIEYKSRSVIKDAFWHTDFNSDYTSAVCHVDPTIDAKTAVTFVAELKDGENNTVARAESMGESVSFNVKNPRLWSPDSPTLYTLHCSIFEDGVLMDKSVQQVGFKELSCRGKRFYLNGEPIFLLGVNRHDIFGEKGHTLTEEEMQKDMRMIKQAGCNFVRLVHYPHNKRIIEIADQIGLLVSEEPGLWWSDMKNQAICDAALEVLEGVIRRDRNHASIAFWLSFNECDFTLEYLKDSAAVARKTDPYRIVSGANCMSLEKTKENYLLCGFDFYTMHPYSPLPDKVLASCEYLTEMPLLFTEWGGYHCHNNPNTFRRFIRTIVELAKNTEDKPCLGGAVFWEWANTYDYNRGAPPVTDGILTEGLVDMERNMTDDLKIFTEEFAKLYEEPQSPYYIKLCEQNAPKGNFEAVDIPQDIDNTEAWDKVITESKLPVIGYLHRDKRQIEIGPALESVPDKIGEFPVKLNVKPLVISDNEICIDIGTNAKAVYIVGNTSMPNGYPICGEYGEEAARYTVVYSDDTRDTHIMKNGIDVTTAATLLGSSRINSIGSKVHQLVEFGYKKDWEQYIINIKRIETNPQKTIESITFSSDNPYYNVLIYGITLEK